MCCGSAARRRFGAADHALAQVRPRQLIFLLGGGGGGGRAINRQTAIFVAASPR